MNNITFTALSQDLYQPLLGKQYQELNETIERIFSEVAARGFSLPQGSTYSSIIKACTESLPVIASLIWEGLSQAYKACDKKPTCDELESAITEAITLEAKRLAARLSPILEQQNALLNRILGQQNAQHNIPSTETQAEHLLSEGRRLVRCYVAESKVLIATVQKPAINQ